ncbi:hypothetical protein ACGFMM_34370 [Streptomyces sp. NPDC048604]|uniref:hypothetical protein n=1 Tax=Streptomyces sp. NPDC048604 TaxID=3365578 RepID=UPI00371A847C
MLDVPRPAHPAGGIFHRLDAEWAALCADAEVQAAVADWLVADRLADGIAMVTDSVTDPWVRTLGPTHLIAALRPGHGRLTDELTDAVLRALLRRAAGCDRSAILAARVIVQAMLPAAVRMTRGQVRSFGGRSFDDIGHMTVAALFEVARSGRIHHRPGRPAANLALDTLRHLCAALASDRETYAGELAAAENLPDPVPGLALTAEAAAVHAAAAAAGLTPGVPANEVEAASACLELLELLVEAIDSGALSVSDARAIAWHYTAAPVPDAVAAAGARTTPGAITTSAKARSFEITTGLQSQNIWHLSKSASRQLPPALRQDTREPALP